MKIVILSSIIVLLLINEITFTYSKDHELFSTDVEIDEILSNEIANIPSKRDKYDIQFKIYLRDFNKLTNEVKHKDKERKIRFKTIKIQRDLIDNYNSEIVNSARHNETNKRADQIEIREISEIEYKKGLAINSLIFIVCLTLVLLLLRTNLVSKTTAIIIYALGLLGVAIYIFFMLFVKQSNVDDNYYRKYNFVKPSEEQILQSKLDYKKSLRKLSEPDVDEIYKNNSIPANSIDVSEYINKALGNNQKCSN
jgi:hypothetical protein